MSYCAIVEFKSNGLAYESINEYKNAYGVAGLIWDCLWNKYIGEGSWSMGNSKQLWELRMDPRLSKFEAAVLISTLDNMIVAKQNYKELATDLLQFHCTYPTPEKVNHLVPWANEIANCKAPAMAFYLHSGGDNMWTTGHGVRGQARYNLKRDNEHWEVYQVLKFRRPDLYPSVN